jgi:tripartite-type tricarboxylate transporter receptor subunit TctC
MLRSSDNFASDNFAERRAGVAGGDLSRANCIPDCPMPLGEPPNSWQGIAAPPVRALNWTARRGSDTDMGYCMAGYSRRAALLTLASAPIAGAMASALTAGLTASPAHADDYPSRPVKIIVPFGAGGPTDVYTRDVAAELQQVLHQAFVMENRPGAGTTIGTEFVANATPDGYTLLMVSGTQTVNETLYQKKSYQLMRDLVPVAPLMDSDLVLVVHPSVPANNLAELIALAKAKPGTLNYGSSGPGSNYHMAGELLRNITGVDIVHVPYKGSSGMRTDILSGQIQLLFDSVPTMASLIKSGMVRPIGTSGKTRSPILPDVPTLNEAGAPGFAATLWVGFMAPKDTPQPIVDLLNHNITSILQRPDIKKAWAEQGATALVLTQPEFSAFMQAEIAKWAKVIQANHIALID